MGKQKDADKLQQKRQLLIERSALALAIPTDEVERLFTQPRQQSVRLNPLRYTDQLELIQGLKTLGWTGEAFDWLQNGYTVDEGLSVVRDSTHVASGQVYIQNASSWLPVVALDPQSGEKILDVCAAPGGKTSHIAAITGNQAYIWANDNSRIRLAKMKANFERLGVTANLTLYDATKLATKLENERFDKILLDAPCSGEGLMSLSDKDLKTWSVAHIRRLQQLQKRLIIQAWELLSPGGTLIYSTCTMAPEENEMVVDYLLRRQPEANLEEITIELPNRVQSVQEWNEKTLDPRISMCLRLAPHPQLEAFFVAKISKSMTLIS